MEVIDINNINESSVINLNREKPRPSVNFGSGIELLMNDKKDDKKGISEIDLDDITELENDLNDISSESENVKVNLKSDIFKSNFKLKFDKSEDENNDESNTGGSKIGIASSKSSYNDEKTWDGFGKFNNIPINPDKNLAEKPKLSNEEQSREKGKILKKLEIIERKGAILSKKYSKDDSLEDLQDELESQISEKEKKNSCKFQGNILRAAINGIEYLNNKLDPFDINLDGWSEQINENIDDYDDIFGELHEKYKSKAKMEPELKLLFQLGGSGILVHMTNTAFKSSMPGMDDIMRQNPDLMNQFTQAAVNSMSNTNPNFSGFMNNFIPTAPQPNITRGPPPPPIQTQSVRSQRASTAPTNRPDIAKSRKGDDGVNMQDMFGNIGPEPSEKSSKRPEMKGPSDISDLLSGLKTKTINIPPDSETKQPIKTKRKQKSDKNTISLDI
jgi:hypothetical protein